MSERYYQDVASIKELDSYEDVNSHLAAEWELLKIAERISSVISKEGESKQESSIVYIVGYKGQRKIPESPQEPQKPKKACNRCGGEIKFTQIGGKWLVFNPDGSPHRCEK